MICLEFGIITASHRGEREREISEIRSSSFSHYKCGLDGGLLRYMYVSHQDKKSNVHANQ